MDPRGKQALLAWLDLLRTSNRIKKTIDSRLKSEFGQSISRFDALSALQRGDPSGIRAGALSRQLVVSEGNITQLMAKLIRDQLVTRHPDPDDARVVIYTLSESGAELFEKMARVHQGWIEEMFGDLTDANTYELRELMKQLNAAQTRGESA